MRAPWPTVLGVIGAGLLLPSARRLRPDVVLCADWPPLPVGVLHGVLYLTGVGLLCASWRAALGERRAPAQVLLLGLPVHLLALCGPPFLSQDPLFYAALGRAQALGASSHAPLAATLPAGDWMLTVLPPHWRTGTSAYGPGFDAISKAVALLAGDRLWLHLRLYQALGLASSLAAALLTGLAARAAAAHRQRSSLLHRGDPSGGRATAAVLFCPLLVIESTQSAHNDALLMVVCAAFALCVARGRLGRGAAWLGAGLLVKASALLLLAVPVAGAAWARLRRLRGRSPSTATVSVSAAVLVLVLALVLVLRPASAPTLAEPLRALLGGPEAPFEYCTRSIECLPRVVLRHLAGAPRAAWLLGLLFRGLGLLWLLRCAAGARDGRLLAWTATFLFGYYLYLHAWSQSWYLLPLLPLLPFTPPRLLPAALTLCVTACAYYTLAIPLACVQGDLAIALTDLAEGLIVIAPPTAVLLWSLRHGSPR